MLIVDQVLSWLAFLLCCVPVVLGPWLFGAWEMWWFWPLTTCIFGACFVVCLRAGALLSKVEGERSGRSWYCGAPYIIFLVYALARALQADVYMTAERSLLLFATPYILAVVIVLGASAIQLTVLRVLIVGNIVALSLYGIINHHVTGSHKVLWVTTEYEVYAGRATGSYFCPDHFAGIAEFLFCIACGIAFRARHHGADGETDMPLDRLWRATGIPLALLALYAVALSQSRGGGVTIAGVSFVCVFLATVPLKPFTRWGTRAACALFLMLVAAGIWNSDTQYVTRFKEYFALTEDATRSREQVRLDVIEAVQSGTRYNMYTAAIRAWQTSPLFGIGPGMHQHLWPHFAPSPDGDRTTGRWPTRPNCHYHSYEVHSDWLQLLEEYGIVGLVLFTLGVLPCVAVLLVALRRRIATRDVLPALLCIAAMAVHSLGDFNLQMPGTTWLFAALIAIPVAQVSRASR